MIWNPLERFLWGIAFIIISIDGFLYLRKGREKENLNEKILLYGFASLLFSIVFMIVFQLLFDLAVPGDYRNNNFYGDYSNVEKTNEIFFKLIWISFHIDIYYFFYQLRLASNVLNIFQ